MIMITNKIIKRKVVILNTCFLMQSPRHIFGFFIRCFSKSGQKKKFFKYLKFASLLKSQTIETISIYDCNSIKAQLKLTNDVIARSNWLVTNSRKDTDQSNQTARYQNADPFLNKKSTFWYWPKNDLAIIHTRSLQPIMFQNSVNKLFVRNYCVKRFREAHTGG